MAEPTYRTAPDATSKVPGGIPYIIGNEAAERFSYYGMRAILVVYMTQYLRGANGDFSKAFGTGNTPRSSNYMTLVAERKRLGLPCQLSPCRDCSPCPLYISPSPRDRQKSRKTYLDSNKTLPLKHIS